MCSSVSFSKLIQFNLHYTPVLWHIPHSKKFLCLFASVPTPTTVHLLSFSVVLPFLVMSYKWNQNVESFGSGFMIPVSTHEDTREVEGLAQCHRARKDRSPGRMAPKLRS